MNCSLVEMKERADTTAQFSALEEVGQHMQTDAVIFRLPDLRARMVRKADRPARRGVLVFRRCPVSFGHPVEIPA